MLRQAERYRLPFVTGAGEGGQGALEERSGTTLDGDGVVLTALRPHELRVVNETPEPRTAIANGERIELGPWEIRTRSFRSGDRPLPRPSAAQDP